jgi:hypothetical protein
VSVTDIGDPPLCDQLPQQFKAQVKATAWSALTMIKE